MLTWLINLIPAYRAMARQVQNLSTEKLQLQDRLDAAEQERTHVWAVLKESLKEAGDAYKLVINEHWQTRYGVAPYPDAPKLPSQMATPQEGGPLQSVRSTGIGIVARAEQDFKRQYEARVQAVQDQLNNRQQSA